MILHIDDQVALTYQQAAERAHVPLQKFLERQLARFVDVPAGQRVIVLTGSALEQVDRLLGLGSTLSPEALIASLEAYAGITIGGIRLDFSPAQLAEIGLRAEKQGKAPEVIVQEIVEQLARDFFYSPVVAR